MLHRGRWVSHNSFHQRYGRAMPSNGPHSTPSTSTIGLVSWIGHDLEHVHSKLMNGVVGLIPRDYWSAPVDNGGSTINHLVLHLARHQDLAINTAIRNRPPIFADHAVALGLTDVPPWAAIAERDDRSVSQVLDHSALLVYVDAVFEATKQWLARTGTMVLDTIPDTSRRLVEHAQLAVDQFDWLHAMWTDKPVWWLLQWPVIGHGHTHVGELTSLRNRLGFSPF